MAQRLTRGMAQARRGPGRPRKDGRPTQRSILAQALAEAEGEEMPPPGPGHNVSDETRLEYLERARIALREVDEAKLVLRSATGIFNQVIKDAAKAGATQIGWTLKQLRRDPDDIRAEITERNKMLQLAQIPVGVQLGLFEGAGETLAEVLAKQQSAAEVVEATWTKEDEAKLHEIVKGEAPVEAPGRDVAEPTTSRPLTTRKRLRMPWTRTTGEEEMPTEAEAQALAKQEKLLEQSFKETNEFAPPRRGPDDEPDEDEDEEKEPEEPEEPDEEEPPMEVAAKPGNEVLERSPDDMQAFKMGERSFRWGRTMDANPFPPVTTMHDAWIRGFKTEEAAKTR